MAPSLAWPAPSVILRGKVGNKRFFLAFGLLILSPTTTHPHANSSKLRAPGGVSLSPFLYPRSFALTLSFTLPLHSPTRLGACCFILPSLDLFQIIFNPYPFSRENRVHSFTRRFLVIHTTLTRFTHSHNPCLTNPSIQQSKIDKIESRSLDNS